jgi:hypothetical protein
MSMKNSKDTIGNRTRDLPACSAVPQPTAPLHAPQNWNTIGGKKSFVFFVINVQKFFFHWH